MRSSEPTVGGARATREYAPCVLFTIGLLLAIFVLPQPWGLVAVAVGATLDIAETGAFWWWSNRRRASVGVEALEGKVGVATSDLWPEGQVKIGGELWRARCTGGCDAGTKVVVRSIEGLTLVVDPA
jgi:membrane protein implicated in regulation of membrane protease activity